MPMVQPATRHQDYPIPEVPVYTVEQGQVAPLPADRSGEDRAEQETRLSTPSVLPDFSDPTVALRTLNSAEASLKGAWPQLQIGEGSSKYKGVAGPAVEALDLADLSSSLSTSFEDGTGVWQHELRKDAVLNELGVNNSNRGALGGAFALALGRVGSDVMTRRYEKILEGDKADRDAVVASEPQEFVFDENYDPFAAEPENKTGRPSADVATDFRDVVHNDYAKQLVMQGFVEGFGAVGTMFSRPASPGGFYETKQLSLASKSALAYQSIQDGFFDLGKDKNGMWYPFLTKKGLDMVNTTQRAAQMYDVEMRHLNTNSPLRLAQNHPPVGNRFSGLQDLFSKDGQFTGNGDVIDTAIEYQNRVGVSVDPIKLSLLNQMAGFALAGQGLVSTPAREGGPVIAGAFSSSPYATTIVDLSEGKFREKYAELIKSGVSPEQAANTISLINQRKIQQVDKHLSEYLPNGQKKGVLFDTLMRSDSTGRVFNTATDIDPTHAGDIRPALGFGIQKEGLISGNLGQTLGKVKDKAMMVFNTKGLTGINIGKKIQESLYKLDETDLAMMDAIYQIGKLADDFGIKDAGTKPKPGPRPTVDWYIQSVTPAVMEQVAAFGRTARGWAQNGSLPSSEERALSAMPPKYSGPGGLSKFFEKKDWDWKVDNAIMAADIVDQTKRGGGKVKLSALIESDASQSNAFIMAQLIGDAEVSALLGNVVGNMDVANLVNTYTDLRNVVASNVSQDVDDTMMGPDEVEKAQAIKELFAQGRLDDPSGFDKTYARGIVVAGLYGKSPYYMFTEVETMLGKLNNFDAVYKLQEMYGGNRDMMLEDLASIYGTSMRKHLNNLQGYQRLATSVGGVIAAFDGDSKFKGFFDTDLDLGMSFITPHDSEKNTVKRVVGIDEESYMPQTGREESMQAATDYQRSAAEIKRMKDQLAVTNASLDTLDQLTDYATFGDKARKTVPVVMIQNGDISQMSAAIVYANQGNKREHPLNLKIIHDAMRTAPGSTLLMINAYNNIAPYLLSHDGASVIKSLDAKVKSAYMGALGPEGVVTKAGKANIGMKGRYKSLSGHFDRIWNNKYRVDRDQARGRLTVRPEMTAKQKEFIENRLKFKERQKRFNELVTQHAMSFGWLPPTKRHLEARQNIILTPADFQQLAMLMLESEGWTAVKNQKRFIKDPDLRWMTESSTKAVEKFINNSAIHSARNSRNSNQITNTK